MIIENEKTWGYKCPNCSADVTEQFGMFDITAYRALQSECATCKMPLGKISRTGDGDYVIEAPCYACREMHTFRVPHKLFWENKLFSLGCDLSGYDICYFGTQSEVEEALEELNGEILKRCEMTEDSLHECDERMRKAVDILQQIAAEGNLFCLCGKNKIQVGLIGDCIAIQCGACGAGEVIHMETEEDLEQLRKRKSIVLVKK